MAGGSGEWSVRLQPVGQFADHVVALGLVERLVVEALPQSERDVV